jgi:hypothetical protein
VWVETGEPVLLPEPLVLVETGELPVAELELPLVDVLTGAAAVAELAVPLVAVVIGADAGAGVVAVAPPATAPDGELPAVAATPVGRVGWWRTLWIVRRITWVRIRG